MTALTPERPPRHPGPDQVGPALLSLYKRASSSTSKHLVQIVAIDYRADVYSRARRG